MEIKLPEASFRPNSAQSSPGLLNSKNIRSISFNSLMKFDELYNGDEEVCQYTELVEVHGRRFTVCLAKYTINGKKFIGAYLTGSLRGEAILVEPLKVHFKITFLSNSPHISRGISQEYEFQWSKIVLLSGYSYNDHILMSELSDPIMGYLQDDYVRIRCVIEVI